MSQKEISETLNIKVGNVKVQLHRGRNELKVLLKAKYPDEFTDFLEKGNSNTYLWKIGAIYES